MVLRGHATSPFPALRRGRWFADPGFVHIESIASRSRKNGGDIRPHSHDTLDQLLIIRAGQAEVSIDGHTAGLFGPAVIHIPAHAVHGFRFEDQISGDVITFSAELRGSLAASQPASPLLAGQPEAHVVDSVLLDRMVSLLDELRLECSGHADGRIAASSWLVGLLLLGVGRSGGKPGLIVEDARMTRFRQLVDRHFREHKPVRFYSDALGLTERSLTRLTQTRIGCAPVRYLHRRLLLEARRQLAYGSQPIARIADELGFADPSYFTRFYRRMTGELPSALRTMG